MEHTTAAPADKYANLDKEKQAASRVTVIGIMLDAVLGLFKVVVGILFHSHALVVDGIHSFTDVASDLMVLGVMRISRRAPDEDHPYGHQRIETFGTLLMGSLLIAVGAALAWPGLGKRTTAIRRRPNLLAGLAGAGCGAVVGGRQRMDFLLHPQSRPGDTFGSDHCQRLA